MTEKHASFEAQALPHAKTLLRFANYLGCRSDAKDLVQETFLKAFRSWDSLKPGTNCEAWLMTILRSKRIDGIRFMQARGGFHDQLNERLAADPDPDQPINECLSDELRSALLYLPIAQREALLMVTIEGLSYQDVARIQCVAEGTAKSRIFRACATLRELLQNYTDQGRLKR